METLHLDFETRSTVPFGSSKGAVTAYQYARHRDTDVLCMSWAIGDEDVRLWRAWAGEPFPRELVDALRAGMTFAAHNAGFEWCIWNFLLHPRLGLPELPITQMDCTAVRAAVMALPRSLAGAAAALGLAVQKDAAGARLMQQMAKPRRPRKGEDPDGIYWWDEPEKMERLGEYCVTDTATERELDRVLRPLSADERELWLLDHRTNFRGVAVDTELARKAKAVMRVVEARYDARLAQLTDGAVTAVTQVAKMKPWLAEQGVTTDGLDKTTVENLLADPGTPAAARELLQIRQEAGKSSVAKLDRFLDLTSDDGRMRENFLHHGANTGRAAGKGAQLQNLPSRGGLKWREAEEVMGMIVDTPDAEWAADCIEMLYGSVPTAISSCLRGIIHAPVGRRLFVADFSNIEGRVAAWLGAEAWKIQAFRDYDTPLLGPDGRPIACKDDGFKRLGPDLYKVTAGQILGIQPLQVDKVQRNVMGKVPELALGFGGGVGAFQSMAKIYNVNMADYWAVIQGALDAEFVERARRNWDSFGKGSGIQAEEWWASEAVKLAWRARHPGIVDCWYDAEASAIKALQQPGRWFPFAGGKCAFAATHYNQVPFLVCRLPNGRRLYRADARLRPTVKFGRQAQQIVFKTVDSVTRQWVTAATYGGDLFQSCVQAIARDLMFNGWRNVEAAGFDVILSVHDEVGAEGGLDRTLEEFEAEMTRLPAWADGCPVSAAGYVAQRYRKD